MPSIFIGIVPSILLLLFEFISGLEKFDFYLRAYYIIVYGVGVISVLVHSEPKRTNIGKS